MRMLMPYRRNALHILHSAPLINCRSMWWVGSFLFVLLSLDLRSVRFICIMSLFVTLFSLLLASYAVFLLVVSYHLLDPRKCRDHPCACIMLFLACLVWKLKEAYPMLLVMVMSKILTGSFWCAVYPQLLWMSAKNSNWFCSIQKDCYCG